LSSSLRPESRRAQLRNLERQARDARRAGARVAYASLCALLAACSSSDTTWLDLPESDALPLTQGTPSALELSDVAAVPAPILRGRGGIGEVTLPGGATPAHVRLLGRERASLLDLAGHARGNRVQDAVALGARGALLVQIEAGSEALVLGEADLFLSDQDGVEHEIYLPALSLAAGVRRELWVARDGSTYDAQLGATTPALTTLARGRVPWWSAPDLSIARVAGGLTRPVGIAAVPSPGPSASAPMLYVAEHGGAIHVLRRDGALGTYAEGLLNFDAPGSSHGLSSIALDPASGDLFVALDYSSDPEAPDAPFHTAVERLSSDDGGLSASTRVRIKSLAPEAEGTSRSLAQLALGPDELVYLLVGDAGEPAQAQDLERYHGKILRFTQDGAPAPRNPHYNAQDGIGPRDFVYASGLRDPRASDWRLADESSYFVEQGLEQDRFARVLPGKNYGWNGAEQGLSEGALYNWTPAVEPSSLAFVQSERLGGSGFGGAYHGRAYVTQSAGSGAGDARHKVITEWRIRPDGSLEDGPRPVALYRGGGVSTPAALVAGTDGLYFTDVSGDDPELEPGEDASLLRLAPVAPAAALDCNLNGVSDASDLALGTSLDCNGQGIPDECDIQAERSSDCDTDAIPDECSVIAPLGYDFTFEQSDLVLHSAQIADGALRLLPELESTASALRAPTTRLLMQRFQVDFGFRIAGNASDGLLFAVYDDALYPDSQSFGLAGLGPASIEIAIDTRADDELPDAIVVRYDDQILGRYAPSFELDDDHLHHVRATFDGRYLNLILRDADVSETAFQALEIPDYAPFVARYGFGSDGAEGAPPVTIDDFVLWLATPSDANGNGQPDSCECPADVDDGSELGHPDGEVTEADLRFFLLLFRSGLLSADLDDGSGSGSPDGAVTIDDVRYFRIRYDAGC
jgi:glucose/arabinose dehydrogenase